MTGMSWDDARREHLVGKRCLWQDLDGLHVAEAPRDAPHTSILWAWPVGSGDAPAGQMVRVRIDRDTSGGEHVFPATLAGGVGAALAPYSPADGRVAAFRAAPDTSMDLSALRLEMVIEPDPPAGAVPLVFIREASHG